MKKRSRRKFSKEYKAEVVTLIRQGNKTIGAVCRDLGLPETAVRRWVKQADVDLGEGPSGALTTAEREELSDLRKRVKTGLVIWKCQHFAKKVVRNIWCGLVVQELLTTGTRKLLNRFAGF